MKIVTVHDGKEVHCDECKLTVDPWDDSMLWISLRLPRASIHAVISKAEAQAMADVLAEYARSE